MGIINILGYAAALFTTAANLPQTVKILKNRSAKDISVVTYLMLTFGGSLWITYGVLKNDLPLIIANASSVFICAIILTLKTLGRNKLQIISEKIMD